MMSLAQVTKEAMPPSAGMRTGTVMALSGTAVTVNVAGASLSVSVLESYSPAVGDVVVLAKSNSTWLVLGRAVAGDSTSVASGNLLGGVHFVSADTKYSGTAEALVDDYTMTVNMPSGNLVQVYASFGFDSTVANDEIVVRVRQDSLTGTQWGEKRVRVHATGVAYWGEVSAWVTGSASTTWVLTAARASGTGTCHITTATTAPSAFLAFKTGNYQAITVV